MPRRRVCTVEGRTILGRVLSLFLLAAAAPRKVPACWRVVPRFFQNLRRGQTYSKTRTFICFFLLFKRPGSRAGRYYNMWHPHCFMEARQVMEMSKSCKLRWRGHQNIVDGSIRHPYGRSEGGVNKIDLPIFGPEQVFQANLPPLPPPSRGEPIGCFSSSGLECLRLRPV